MHAHGEMIEYHSSISTLACITLKEAAHAHWIYAGMTVRDGALDRPLNSGMWLAPTSVQLTPHRTRLRWSAKPPLRLVGPLLPDDSELLDDFLALSDGDAEDVERFGERWGVLTFGAGELVGPLSGSESIEDWNGLARHFESILSLAADVHLGNNVEGSRWDSIQYDGKSLNWPAISVRGRHRRHVWIDSRGMSHRYPAEPSKFALGVVVSEWLRAAPSMLQVILDPTPRVLLVPQGLVAALVQQLALATAKTDGLAFCTSCARPYIPPRRPSQGRGTYCSACGVKAARRDAQRRYAQKRKGE